MRESGSCRTTDGALPPLPWTEEKTGGETNSAETEVVSLHAHFTQQQQLILARRTDGDGSPGRPGLITRQTRCESLGTFRGLRRGKGYKLGWKKSEESFSSGIINCSSVHTLLALGRLRQMLPPGSARAATIFELFTISPNHHDDHQQLNTPAAATAFDRRPGGSCPRGFVTANLFTEDFTQKFHSSSILSC